MLESRIRKLREELESCFIRNSRLADQLSSLRAAVDMPELYLDDDWRILGYSIHFPGISRKVVECKKNSVHLSQFLKPGDFMQIEKYLARVNELRELLYDDGEPWRLVYEGPREIEQLGVDWVPYRYKEDFHWVLKRKSDRSLICHSAHLDDSADCYLMSAREYGDAETDVKIVYRTRTAADPAKIRDLSLVISGGAGSEAILPDLLGYTASTARGNSKAEIQRETATVASTPESLKPDTTYEITVERTGGRITRLIKDESTGETSPPLIFFDPKARYDRQNHIGFNTFSGEAEFFDVRIYERRSRFSIDQFTIPFDIEVGINDRKVSDRIYKLRLGRDSSRGSSLNVLIFEDITQSRKDHQDLACSQKQLRSLSRHLQSVREEERARIAREVHDELGQILTALKLDLTWIGLKLTPEQTMIKRKTHSMAATIDSAIRTVQKISGDLRPGMLDDLGLEAAIEWQAGKFSDQTGIECEVRMPSDNLKLSKDLATNLFRILQETLTNIARHSRAEKSWISLEEKGKRIIMVIKDNGIGLPRNKIHHPLSLGLIGIKERVIQCGGEIDYKSRAGNGTTVKVTVPMEITTND